MQGLSQFKRLFPYKRFFSRTISEELLKEVSPSIKLYEYYMPSTVLQLHTNHSPKRTWRQERSWPSMTAWSRQKISYSTLCFMEQLCFLYIHRKHDGYSILFTVKQQFAESISQFISPSSEVANRVTVLRRINTFFLLSLNSRDCLFLKHVCFDKVRR